MSKDAEYDAKMDKIMREESKRASFFPRTAVETRNPTSHNAEVVFYGEHWVVATNCPDRASAYEKAETIAADLTAKMRLVAHEFLSKYPKAKE